MLFVEEFANLRNKRGDLAAKKGKTAQDHEDPICDLCSHRNASQSIPPMRAAMRATATVPANHADAGLDGLSTADGFALSAVASGGGGGGGLGGN